jgi:hypothetical protein
VVLVIRGACQPFKFKMPYDFNDLKAVRVTIWQLDDNGDQDSVTITKEILPSPDMYSEYDWAQYHNKELYVTLDQYETLQFSSDRKGFVQLSGATIDGFVFKSFIETFSVYPTKDEAIFE